MCSRTGCLYDAPLSFSNSMALLLQRQQKNRTINRTLLFWTTMTLLSTNALSVLSRNWFWKVLACSRHCTCVLSHTTSTTLNTTRRSPTFGCLYRRRSWTYQVKYTPEDPHLLSVTLAAFTDCFRPCLSDRPCGVNSQNICIHEQVDLHCCCNLSLLLLFFLKLNDNNTRSYM